jgi:membrane protease subunit (stomatin/prohibitin family)
MLRRPGFRRGPGLLGTMARTAVVAGTATAVAGGVRRRQMAREDQAAEEQEVRAAALDSQAQLSEMRAQQAASPPTDMVAELERLAKLRDSGVLDAAEFDAAKAKLLGT